MVTQNDNSARGVEMGYYIFEETEYKRKLEGRYWNPGIECYPHLNICVVASITKMPNGEGFDWAGYIGADPAAHTEEAALKTVASYGAKLSEKDARYFFPDIELPYRR